MNAVVSADFDIVDDNAPEFFAPVASDVFDSLLGQYDAMRRQIESVGVLFADAGNAGTLHYFLEGNRNEDRGRHSLEMSAEQLFDVKGAIGALNAAYWSKALHQTDVLNLMPQKRRDDWHQQIRNPLGIKTQRGHKCDPAPAKEWEVEPLPDFTADTVRASIVHLLNMRAQFLGERVDGIFRGLSGDHVTNAPEGFGKRMIIARVLDSYDSSDSRTCGLINDLRCVVAKFMGRDEPNWTATDGLVKALRRRWGEWTPIDGGAMRIRLYKKGTAHMEVHPDMAWRLNSILAHLHPLAIPAEFRTKPKRKAREFTMMGRPLPFSVVSALAEMRVAYERIGGPNAWPEKYKEVHNARKFDSGYGRSGGEAERVLFALGATKVSNYFQFDYNPDDVLDQVVASGCIPDQQAHQYYPTPDLLAAIAVAWADIQDGCDVLEPSAGQGHLAALLPKERTTCVEISPLHCKILEAKGHHVVQGDFITWAGSLLARYNRVVMNPPFSEGRAQLHVERAFDLLKPGGILVSIMPSGMRNKQFLEGVEIEWSKVYENEFAGTSVDVVMMRAVRAA